jgi:4-hydroxybenzoate polyprenyltransferase
MGWLQKLKSFLLVSRWPNLLIIAFTQYMAAWMLYRNGLIPLPGWELFYLIVSTTMVAAGGYIINDYYDMKIDMINRPEQVVVGRSFSRRQALISHFLLAIAAIVIGWLFSWKIALAHFFSINLLWYYSNHLRRLFIGKIAIASLTALCLLIIGLGYGVVSYRLMAFATLGASVVWVRELLKDLDNARGAEKFGVESVPSVWGLQGTKALILAITFFTVTLLIFFVIQVKSNIIAYYYAGHLPFVGWFIYKVLRADRRQHYRHLKRFTNLIILSGLVSMLFV